MPDRTLKQKRWGPLFAGIHLFLLAQVVWWTAIFIRNVDDIRALKIKNHGLEVQLGVEKPMQNEEIDKEVFRRHLMFFSESGFFVIVASIGFYLLFRAIRTEEKSREIQRNFIEVVSHESKTPLTALKLRLEAVSEKSKGDEGLVKDLNSALEEVRRLSSILEKALQLNRVESRAFSFEEVELSELVQAVVKRLDPLFREKKISVTVHTEPELYVKGDRFGLENSLQSLLENSALYNDSAAKTLDIHLQRELGFAVLTVSDNGPGIAEKDEAKVFDRFYRGKSGKKVPGTGLGLYLAKGIISAHHGILRLSRKEDRGAKFEVQLPLLLEAS